MKNKNQKRNHILTIRTITAMLLIAVMLFSPVFSSVAYAIDEDKNLGFEEDDGVTYGSWIQDENIYDSIYEGTTDVAPSEENAWADINDAIYEEAGETMFAPVAWMWELGTWAVLGFGVIIETCLDGGAGLFDQNFTMDAII